MTVNANAPDQARPRRAIEGLGPVVMRQVWSDLLFLHWAVPETALRPLIPSGLEIDTFEGRAYVGLVPFAMSGVRPVFVPPVPGLSRFLEVNVRTYVRLPGGREPGVWFFSLDAASRLAVAVARRFWHLPYHFARMRMDRAEGGGNSQATMIRYVSKRVDSAAGTASCTLAYTPTGSPAEAEPGTLDHFLVERYLLYARRGPALWRGRVAHRPYRIQGADLQELSETLVAASGIARPDDPPRVLYARGVDVRIHPLRPVNG